MCSSDLYVTFMVAMGSSLADRAWSRESAVFRVTGVCGTGWGAEFAKICNKPLLVFDQEQDGWYRWLNDAWVKVEEPVIEHTHFTATGTRFMEANGRKAISDLFARSFNR